MRIHRYVTSLVLLALVQIPAVAQAKPGKNVREKEKAARKACMVGNYQEGVNILADLFIELEDVNYIYNQARCLQQNHRWEEALDRFREYLRKATNITPAEKAEIDQYISECEAHLPKAASTPALEPTLAASPPPPPPPPVAPVVPVAPIAPAAPIAPVPTEDRGAGLRTAGIIAGAVGLAGLGVGVFCSAKTYSLRDKPDDLDTFKTVGIISYAAGGAALATGVTLYMVGAAKRNAPAQESAVALVPVVGPGTGAVLLQGRF